MIDLGPWFAAGVGLGAVTGLPLGVVNVAIVEAASRRGARAAAGIGVGGAGADLSHAALAFGGVGQVVIGRPEVSAILHVAAGVILCGYALALWRRREGDGGAARARPAPTGFARGLGLGLALTLPNPAALGAWLAVAAAVPPPSLAAALVAALGVGIGSAAWFVALAHLAARGAAGSAAIAAPRRGLTRPVALVLAALGLAAFARAAL